MMISWSEHIQFSDKELAALDLVRIIGENLAKGAQHPSNRKAGQEILDALNFLGLTTGGLHEMDK